MTTALVSYSDVEKMAAAVSKSGCMGFKKQEDALTVMLMAAAEGYHPMIGIRDYHLIQGKPALKADAMLARFQQSGGKVKWLALTDEKVSAEFTHPSGGSATIDWDIARSKKAGLGSNGMWSKYPRQMLRARVISEGIRTVFPGVIVGSYTEEEIIDFDGVTIDGEVKPDLSIQCPDGMSKEDQKKLAVEAAEALEAVQDQSELDSWYDSWYKKAQKNLPASWTQKLTDKAVTIATVFQNKVDF